MFATMRRLTMLPLAAAVLVWGLSAQPAAARGHGHGGHHGHHGHRGHHHHRHHHRHHAHHAHHRHHHNHHRVRHHTRHTHHYARHYHRGNYGGWGYGARNWWWGNPGATYYYQNRVPYNFSYYANYPQLVKWYTNSTPYYSTVQQQVPSLVPMLNGTGMDPDAATPPTNGKVAKPNRTPARPTAPTATK